MPNRDWRRSITAVLILAFAFAFGAHAAAPPEDWRSPLSQDHPLVGTIWPARDGQAIKPSALAAALARARFVLLGEVHDNDDHHRLQAWGLKQAVAGENKSAVAFEMLSEDQQPGLQAFAKRASHERSLETFPKAVGWNKSGWPPFEIYAPIFEVVLRSKISIASASALRNQSRAVSKSGLGVLGESETKRLALDQPLASSLVEVLGREIKAAHCDLFPDEAVPRMASVQYFRDAVMADAMLSSGSGAILIAGNVHVRRDRGAPLYLERRGVPAADIVSVMHKEVEDGRLDAASYVPRAPDGAAAVDYVWFTPRQKRSDPCEGLREKLNKRKK